MEIKSLDNIFSLEEMNHIISGHDCYLIASKFEELGASFVTFIYIHAYIDKTILEFAKSLDVFHDALPKILCIILNALWPDRFELLLN